METLKRIFPGVWPLLSALKTKLLRLLSRHTDSQALRWRRIALSEIEKYWQTSAARSNEFLLDVLSNFSFDSLLELGCNCGPRLYAINRRWPDARFKGIDLNPQAIAFGNEKLRLLGITNISLSVGRIEQIDQLPDRSFDICFSWASLMYLRPRFIQQVLLNTLRIARKAIILFEMHSGFLDGLEATGQLHGVSNWKRNYEKLFLDIGVQASQIEIRPIPVDVWAPGGGGGSCIIVHQIR